MASRRKVQQGEPLIIPAEAYNSFVDAASAFQSKSFDRSQAPQPQILSPGQILILNDTNQDLAITNVVGLGVPKFLPSNNLIGFQTQPLITGVKPQKTNHSGKFAILAEPIKKQTVGRAYIGGIFAVRLKDWAEGKNFVDVADNDVVHLKATSSGPAEIIWKGPGSTAWALVQASGSSGANPIRPVLLTNLGGSQGGPGLIAGFIYSVVDAVTLEVIATGISPINAPHQYRRGYGLRLAASFGYGFWNPENVFILTWVNETDISADAFPISLSKTSGEEGSGTEAATWRYSITDPFTGVSLGTNVDPTSGEHWWRRPLGAMNYASSGFASRSVSGNLLIGWINEYLVSAGGGGVFPVVLRKTSGLPGDGLEPAGYVYRILNLEETEILATDVDPTSAPHKWVRANGQMNPATFGYAHTNSEAPNGFVLGWINEVYIHQVCDS